MKRVRENSLGNLWFQTESQSQQLSRQPQLVQRKWACSGVMAPPQMGHSSNVPRGLRHAGDAASDCGNGS